MSKRRYDLYLHDILDAIGKIENYKGKRSKDQFLKSGIRVDAVVRNVEIIGEAAKHVPPHLRRKYSQIPWKDIVGMRNRISHKYFEIDEKILWKTINLDLPILQEQIKKMLESLGNDSRES